MIYSFAECRKKFGSPYQIEKAIAGGCLWKLGVGVYSDTGEENELEIVQWRHPHAVMTLDSAYFYYDLTDSVPEFYYMATDPADNRPACETGLSSKGHGWNRRDDNRLLRGQGADVRP